MHDIPQGAIPNLNIKFLLRLLSTIMGEAHHSWHLSIIQICNFLLVVDATCIREVFHLKDQWGLVSHPRPPNSDGLFYITRAHHTWLKLQSEQGGTEGLTLHNTSLGRYVGLHHQVPHTLAAGVTHLTTNGAICGKYKNWYNIFHRLDDTMFNLCESFLHLKIIQLFQNLEGLYSSYELKGPPLEGVVVLKALILGLLLDSVVSWKDLFWIMSTLGRCGSL